VKQEEIDEIMERYENAASLCDELHTERLVYSEYLALINSLQDIPNLIDQIDNLSRKD